MFLTLMEMMWGGDNRKHGDVALHLCLHQFADNRLRDKVVMADAAIDNKGAGDDRGLAPGSAQHARLQRNFERTGHIEDFDRRGRF